MDPQKRFLASTLQGAFEADVLSAEDLFRHVHSAVLAEHVPLEILWACVTEGTARAGLGPFPAGAGGVVARDTVPPPRAENEPEETSDELSALEAELGAEPPIDYEHSTEISVADGVGGEVGAPPGGSIDIDVTEALDDLPPLPDDELSVEDVDWDEGK